MAIHDKHREIGKPRAVSRSTKIPPETMKYFVRFTFVRRCSDYYSIRTEISCNVKVLSLIAEALFLDRNARRISPDNSNKGNTTVSCIQDKLALPLKRSYRDKQTKTPSREATVLAKVIKAAKSVLTFQIFHCNRLILKL